MGVRPRTTLLLFFYFKISSSYGMSGRCKNNVQGGLRVLCSVSPTGNVLHYHGTVLKPGNWHWYNPHSLLISRFLTLKSDFVSLNFFFFKILTDHSVMEELMSVTAMDMKTLPFIAKDLLQNEMFIFQCLLYFSSFIYFASFGVTKERKKSKDLMKMMGLQDSAFWWVTDSNSTVE